MITFPTNLTLPDWTAQVGMDLDRYGSVEVLRNDDWKEWGARLIASIDIGRNIPNPYHFDNWVDWAERVCGALS